MPKTTRNAFSLFAQSTVCVTLLFCLALLSCSGPGLKADPSAAWNFEDGTDHWMVWGVVPPADATDAERQHIYRDFVRWDETKGMDHKGALRILGHEDEWTCYAISPSVAISPGKDKVFQGWLTTETGKYPDIFVLFTNEAGEFKGVAKTKILPSFVTEKQKAGWVPFHYYLPANAIPAGGTHVQLCVRPAPTGDNATGNVWLTDVSYNEVSNQPISLQPEMNRGFQDDVAGDGKGGWTDQGDNDLRGMQPGTLNVSKMPFTVIDPAKNNGNSVIALRHQGPGFLQQASVPLNAAKYDRIYLLHAAAWANQKTPVGYVDFHYTNGTTATQSISSGEQVGDWWNPGTLNQAVSIPLDNVNPQKSPVYLVAASLENPSPDLSIDHLTFRSGDTPAVWLVLAATGSNGPATPLEKGVDIQRGMQSWQQFVPSIRPTPKNAVSLEFLLDAPAGKHGFVHVKDGHFQFQDGTPVRFWGTNIHSVFGFFPTHEEAELIADTLARYGCNIVRLHLPEDVFAKRTSRTSQTFLADEDKWDRFDYLVKCLEDKGIYIHINSITGLSFLNIPKDSTIGDIPEEAPFFDPQLQRLGVEFMDHLLSHKNRYTGLRLVDDPAVPFVSLLNETSLFWDFNPAKWSDAYKKMLQDQYNKWLLQQYKDRAGLASAWKLQDGSTALKTDEDPAKGTVALGVAALGNNRALSIAANAPEATRVRVRELVRFFRDRQYQFNREMSQHAESLGLKVPIIGSSMVFHMAELATMRSQGVTDQHAYWDLDISGHYQDGRTAQNIPEVTINPIQQGTGLSESILSAVKIAGSATVNSEVDAPWPSEWRSSHLMMIGATAALRDNDAIFQYAYGGGFGFTWDTMKNSQAIMKPTVEFNDPAVLASFVAGSFLFLRQDVDPAKNLIRLDVDKDLSLATEGRVFSSAFPFNYVPFVSRYETFFEEYPSAPNEKPDWVIHDRGDGSQAANTNLAQTLDAALKEKGLLSPNYGIQKGKIISDTGQLVRDWEHQLFLVNTPRSQGFTGFPSHDPIVLPDVQITSASPFATFLVSSLEQKPLSEAKRFFVTAVSRADNSDAKYSYNNEATMPQGGKRGLGLLESEGKGPVVIEPVHLTLTMKGEKYRLTPLGPDMAPIPGASLEFSGSGGTVNIEIGKGQTSVWYLLEKLP
jgi:hypothetical protein